jgi:DNA processing protein
VCAGAGRDVYAVPGNATNKNSWEPNTLIKQGAKLTATWQDIWEGLPSQVRVELEDEMQTRAGLRNGRDESFSGADASLFADAGSEVAGSGQPMSEHERLVIQELRQAEAVQLDALIERLETKLVSGEIFTALFELEIAGRVRQMPGKKYVRRF